MADKPKGLRGDRLRQLRESYGLSQGELAKRIGSSLNMVNRYENGLIDPPSAIVKRLAREFQVTTDYLLGLVEGKAAHLESYELTRDEREFIEALRAGKLKVLLGMLQDAIPDEGEQPDVPGPHVTPNGDALDTTERTIPH